jgi:membrane fusion protein (multidrug efflux system)
LALAVAVCGCKKEPAHAGRPPAGVIAAEVLVRDQPVYVEFIGQTIGGQDVEIRARVAGFLETIHFREGSTVESNALLYKIDPRPFESTLAQALGGLAQAEAMWDKARRDTNRFGPLWEKHAVSRQQYDDKLSAERAARADLQMAEAAVESARIQLGYTEIRAPLTGIAGKSEVSIGNLVGQGQTTLLTTVSSVDPIHVRFSVSERDYMTSQRRAKASAAAGKIPPEHILELILADGAVHSQKGKIVFGDREIDPSTGTFLIEASFPNPGNIIRPGQFARVRFPVDNVQNAILVPQRAVRELQATYSVFVITPTNTAAPLNIEIASRVGNYYLVKSGLKPGDKIVVDGLQKLMNNAPVTATYTNLPGPAL